MHEIWDVPLIGSKREQAQISWFSQNPSTYMIDSGLRKTCKESSIIIRDHYRLNQRRTVRQKNTSHATIFNNVRDASLQRWRFKRLLYYDTSIQGSLYSATRSVELHPVRPATPPSSTTTRRRRVCKLGHRVQSSLEGNWPRNCSDGAKDYRSYYQYACLPVLDNRLQHQEVPRSYSYHTWIRTESTWHCSILWTRP